MHPEDPSSSAKHSSSRWYTNNSNTSTKSDVTLNTSNGTSIHQSTWSDSNRFALTIREVTSVSTTFILASAFSLGGHGRDKDGIKKVRDENEDENGEDTEDDGRKRDEDLDVSITANDANLSSANVLSTARNPVLLSETLNKSLSVHVNSAVWKRVLVHVNDAEDSATIILYGLMPGRQYDIEINVYANEGSSEGITGINVVGDCALAVTGSKRGSGLGMVGEDSNGSIALGGGTQREGREILRTQLSMVTPASNHNEQVSSSMMQDDQSIELIDMSGSHAANALGSTGMTPPRITIEDRAAQLRQQLTQLTSERDAVSLDLKNARKDAQKADAAVKSETDALKRAAEKYAPVEHRARQKVLALQEAVKQTLAAATETDDLVRELEVQLPLLKERELEIEKRHEEVKKEAEKSRDEYEEVKKEDKKKLCEMQSEVTSLGNRLDKLTGKKDKLSGEIIPDLEAQLEALVKKIEAVEMDADEYGSEAEANTTGKFNELNGENDNVRRQQQYIAQRQPAPIGSQRPASHHNYNHHHHDHRSYSVAKPNVPFHSTMRSPTSPLGPPFPSRVSPSQQPFPLASTSTSDPSPRFSHQRPHNYSFPNSENQPNSASSTSSIPRDSQSQSSGSGSGSSPFLPQSSNSSPSPFNTSFSNNIQSNLTSSRYPHSHPHSYQHQHQLHRSRPSPPVHNPNDGNANAGPGSIFIVDPARGPNGGVRPISPGPTRQTSLPINMPSYIGSHQGHGHTRYRSTAEGL